jgi:hypothetical protein
MAEDGNGATQLKLIPDATAAQIQQIRKAVTRKRQRLLTTRRRNQDEIKQLQEMVADLRRDVAERRCSIMQRQSGYQAALAQGMM